METTDTPTKIEKEDNNLRHFKHEILKSYIQSRIDTYVYGPTGSSKTKTLAIIAEELKLPFYKKLISSQMTESSLLGYMDAQGRYVNGIAFEPYSKGGILLLDEIDNGNPNTNTLANGLTDDCMAFPNGMQYRHKDFVLVTTANTTGAGATIAYVGRNKLDAALLNRFPFIEWPYDISLEWNLCLKIYQTYAGESGNIHDSKIKEHFVDFMRLRRATAMLNIPIILSTRNLIQQTKLLAIGRDIKEVYHSVVFKGMDKNLAEKLLTTAMKITNLQLMGESDGLDNIVKEVKEKKIKEKKKEELVEIPANNTNTPPKTMANFPSDVFNNPFSKTPKTV